MPLFGGPPPERERYDAPPQGEWAQKLRKRMKQGAVNFFILHGPGVRDLHPLGARRYGAMREYLAETVFSDRAAVVTYDRGAGIRFTDSGTCSDGFRTKVLPPTTANGRNQSGTIAGKLKGAIAAHTPIGCRIATQSMPDETFSRP